MTLFQFIQMNWEVSTVSGTMHSIDSSVCVQRASFVTILISTSDKWMVCFVRTNTAPVKLSGGAWMKCSPVNSMRLVCFWQLFELASFDWNCILLNIQYDILNIACIFKRYYFLHHWCINLKWRFFMLLLNDFIFSVDLSCIRNNSTKKSSFFDC